MEKESRNQSSLKRNRKKKKSLIPLPLPCKKTEDAAVAAEKEIVVAAVDETGAEVEALAESVIAHELETNHPRGTRRERLRSLWTVTPKNRSCGGTLAPRRAKKIIDCIFIHNLNN